MVDLIPSTNPNSNNWAIEGNDCMLGKVILIHPNHSRVAVRTENGQHSIVDIPSLDIAVGEQVRWDDDDQPIGDGLVRISARGIAAPAFFVIHGLTRAQAAEFMIAKRTQSN